MADSKPFIAHGPMIFVEPGRGQMRWRLLEIAPTVEPNPREAARIVADALNAHPPAVQAVRNG